MRLRTIAITIVFSALAATGESAWIFYRPTSASVFATLETAPVRHEGDAADDPAIWVNPIDPSLSLVLGTDKHKDGSLHVYDLSGAELQSIDGGGPNNVDIRSGVCFGDGPATIAVASAKHVKKVLVYRLHESTRKLEQLESSTVSVGVEPSGICMGRSATSGKTYFFVNGRDAATGEFGIVEQYEMRFDRLLDCFVCELVRRFDVGREVEGCVVDDAYGSLFISEESVAVWRYGIEPGSGEDRVAVDRVGLSGHIRYQAEGIALYSVPDGGGFVLVSSQGSNDFTVYDRKAPHMYRGRFKIVDGVVDGVSHTDGIDVCSSPLGGLFPEGLFVAQDDHNDGENQNFKFVSWKSIQSALLHGE